MSARHRYLELFIQVVIIYSIITHFLEIEFGETEHTTGFFLWSEHVVAAIFTVEYLVRWIASRSIWYPFQPMAIIDLLAVLPFYLSFMVDLRSLRLLRTLRILRLFKLERHSHALQNLLRAFNHVRYEFAVIGFAALIVVWCGAVTLFEFEHEAQPKKFAKLSDAVWCVVVTVTTVGYGDVYPVTGGGRIVASCTMLAGMVLFGTFISLIGSSFLEEIRQSIRQQGRAGPGSPNAEGVPENLRAMTQGSFDPRQVLHAIEGGVLHSAQGPVHEETLRLLAVACRILGGEGKRQEGTTV